MAQPAGDPMLESPPVEPESRRFGWLARYREGARHLPVESARSRTSAYVYGNILVLAAVLGVGSESIADGAAVVVVVTTTVTTYLAHVAAHDIGQRILHSGDEHLELVREELADAVPILSSGVVPALVLGAAALGWIATEVAQIAAAAIVVLRLAATGLTVERLSHRRASASAFWSGVALALTSAVIALLKVTLTH